MIIPLSDGYDSDLPAILPKAIDFLDRNLMMGNVAVHCAKGDSRS